uniref:Uncharacterized protein n=1 Tax=Rhodosorus marinus TaxID=101924 RepID=A0A7S3EJN1_9RHOD|mmetsp:Transcript_41681/g.163634  ORF Transcript_41681/g.163634 Transcript_41681/m.163634 type:complete len:318 (+) Transcript_41681:328-1281(+)
MSCFVGSSVVKLREKRHRRFVNGLPSPSSSLSSSSVCWLEMGMGGAGKVSIRRAALGAAAFALGMVLRPEVVKDVRAQVLPADSEVQFVIKENRVSLPTKNSVLEKLRNVPVFAITDRDGRPFLAEVDNVQEGEQASVFFFSYEDAEQVLDKLKKKSQDMTKNAEINVLTMDEAYKKAKGKALPSGIMNKRGREILVVFRFYADTREVREAERILKRDGIPKDQVPQVPVFLAEGLTIRLGKQFVVPLYFSKEDLDKTWQNVREKTPDMPKSPPVHVVDLVKVLEGMENKALDNIGFFPSRKSIEKVRSMQTTVQPE